MFQKLLFAVCLLYSSTTFAGINFEDISWKAAKKKAKEENKLIFIDFYTTWCGPCKKMDAEVLSTDAAGSYFNAHFINLKVNAEEGQGPVLKSMFEVRAYPTYAFIDAEGEVVDIYVGSRQLSAFIKRAQSLENKDYYLTTLESRYKSGDRSPEFMDIYFSRMKECRLGVNKQLKDYWAKQTGPLMLEPSNWSIIQKCAADIESDQFKYVADNKAAFSEKYGEDQVLKYMENAYLTSMWEAFSLDQTRKFEKIKKLLQDSDYSFKEAALKRASKFSKPPVTRTVVTRTAVSSSPGTIRRSMP